MQDSEQEDIIDALHSINFAKLHLADFEELSIEEQYGAIDGAIEELRNARRSLPDE